MANKYLKIYSTSIVTKEYNSIPRYILKRKDFSPCMCLCVSPKTHLQGSKTLPIA